MTLGHTHSFHIKTVTPLRWRAAGKQNLRLVIIRPLGYRLSKQAPLLYRKPAYLICTAPELPLTQLLQAYLWRWEIEGGFRDQKQLIGIGEAHVRTPQAIAFALFDNPGSGLYGGMARFAVHLKAVRYHSRLWMMLNRFVAKVFEQAGKDAPDMLITGWFESLPPCALCPAIEANSIAMGISSHVTVPV